MRRLFPDPALCTRCGHYEGLHRSRVVYPPNWGNQLARPCIRVAPTGKGVRECGCPDFDAPVPLAVRALDHLTRPRVLDLIIFVFLAGLVLTAITHESVWVLATSAVCAGWLGVALALHHSASRRPKHWNGVSR